MAALKIITTIIDVLFTPRASELLLRSSTRDALVAKVTVQRFESQLYLLPYQDPLVAAVITENKFHHNQTASDWLGCALHVWLESISDPVTLVPIPLSNKRYRDRGYNQVSVILSKIPKAKNITISETLLSRIKDTKPQTTLARSDRLQNIQNAFKASCNNENIPNHIIIIDDVTTTGATLKAAKAAFLAVDPTVKITLVALAH